MSRHLSGIVIEYLLHDMLRDVAVDQDRSQRYLYSILRSARSELVSVGE
jgi:hypothetical protein